MRCILKSFCVSTMFVLALSGISQAQIASGSGEVAGDIGISSVQGANNSRGHVFLGASAAYNVLPNVALGFEYNYQLLGSTTQFGVTESGHLQLVGPVVRVALSESSHVVPYVLGDGGYANVHASASAGSISASASQNGSYFGFGGGASIYAGPNWGVRPEFRYDRIHVGSGTNDVQGLVSVFYQFGGKRSMKKK